MLIGNPDLGREKQEPLSGTSILLFLIVITFADIYRLGLTDKEIEEKVTTLVKTGI